MKGIIFTEFLEMVEDRFSPEIADRIIEAADLPSGGAYTAIGTYDASGEERDRQMFARRLFGIFIKTD